MFDNKIYPETIVPTSHCLCVFWLSECYINVQSSMCAQKVEKINVMLFHSSTCVHVSITNLKYIQCSMHVSSCKLFVFGTSFYKYIVIDVSNGVTLFGMQFRWPSSKLNIVEILPIKLNFCQQMPDCSDWILWRKNWK